MRTRPTRSVTKSRPSGARSTAHGARSPDATSCTFSTTAGPIRGDGVGVGLADAGAGVVGIGIVVVFGEELGDGCATQETRRTAVSRRAAAGPVPGAGPRARLPVRCSDGAIGRPATRPVNGSRATRPPLGPAAPRPRYATPL